MADGHVWLEIFLDICINKGLKKNVRDKDFLFPTFQDSIYSER